MGEVKELTPEQEYAAALERVTVALTEAELAAALNMIAEMLEDPESVHRTNPKNKTELIRLAKNKQAQNKDVWTPKVAAAFRKCLVCFSRGPQLGATMMSGVRNMRNQLRSITGGSSS